MKITINSQKQKELIVPTGKFADGDWFKCASCGYTVRMRVKGDTATCSKCGGTMNRLHGYLVHI